jgi:hypothetical protein
MIHFQRIEDNEMPPPVLSGRELVAQKERQKDAIVRALVASRSGPPESWYDRYLATLHVNGFDVTPFAPVTEQSIHESSSSLGHG